MANDGYDLWFLEVPEGRAFYPLSAMGLGFLGKGFLVDAVTEAQIRRRLRWSPWIIWAGTMITMTVRSFAGSHQSWILAAGFLMTCSAPSLVLNLYARRLPPSCKRVGLRESLKHAARTMTYGVMYTQFVLGSLFVLCGAAALVTSFADPALGAFATVLGIAMLTAWALIWRTQARISRGEARRSTMAAPPLRQP